MFTMHLTHETGKATIIQFLVMAVLNIANTIDSIISTCTHPGGQCVPNMLTSIIFYILIIVWFAIIMGLGYQTQEKRSKSIIRLLIAAELAVFVIAAYNIHLGITYHNGALSLFTSLFDLIFSAWVISLAFRLRRAGGGRVVTRRRSHGNSKVPPL
jgi:hypothetical protein